MFWILISKLAGLGSLFALGFYFDRRNLLSEAAVNGLSWLIVDVTMPALFFCGVLKSGFNIENKGLIVALLGGFGVSALGMLLSWPLLRLFPFKNREKGAFWFDACVGNSSFMPLPIAMALWGDQGVMACLAYVLGNNVFLFTLGIGLLKGSKMPEKADVLRIFTHPQALAFAAGMALFALKIPCPAWLFEPLDGLGKATLPLAMLATGAILGQSKVKWQGRAPLLASLGAFKLLILPLAVYLCLKPLQNGPFGGVGAALVLLEAAMPSLASAGVYARRFGGDASLAAAGSLVTTLACPLTIPLWMALWELK